MILSAKFETTKSMFSSDGKCPQLEYASKAVSNSALCIGIRCIDGVLLAATTVESLPETTENMQQHFRISEQREYLHKIDSDICVGLTGIQSDCLHVLRVLRQRALSYYQSFGSRIPCEKLSEFIASYLHEITMESSSRPLAVFVALAARETNNNRDNVDVFTTTNIAATHESTIESSSFPLFSILSSGECWPTQFASSHHMSESDLSAQIMQSLFKPPHKEDQSSNTESHSKQTNDSELSNNLRTQYDTSTNESEESEWVKLTVAQAWGRLKRILGSNADPSLLQGMSLCGHHPDIQRLS